MNDHKCIDKDTAHQLSRHHKGGEVKRPTSMGVQLADQLSAHDQVLQWEPALPGPVECTVGLV